MVPHGTIFTFYSRLLPKLCFLISEKLHLKAQKLSFLMKFFEVKPKKTGGRSCQVREANLIKNFEDVAGKASDGFNNAFQ